MHGKDRDKQSEARQSKSINDELQLQAFATGIVGQGSAY